MNNREIQKDIVQKDILFYLEKENIKWYESVQIRPIRILRAMDKYFEKAINKIQVRLSNDVLFKTFVTYEKIIQVLIENPNYEIVETVDYSHGYEVTITIEDSTNPEKFFISPFWGTHEMEFLVKSGIFKKIDYWRSDDETMSTMKYKLKN